MATVKLQTVAKKNRGNGNGDRDTRIVTDAYGAYLRKLVDEGDLSMGAVVRASGLGRSTVDRFWKGERPTYHTAQKLRRALARLLPDHVVYPVAVRVGDVDDFSWIAAGELLRKTNPDLFDSIKQTAVAAVDESALTKAERELAEQIRALIRRKRLDE